ncbi:hypothetical protein PR202_gb22792 [Eleusine coracana subsp. coracana]|uniref:Uncharacterized protein n=1 Tax=Eleusine coracana subsp. coracana TaxID=191504 RepID=A0AAV5FEJ5_ELECO|nr:hypothetical protein PR202_gb22792 [Eleusine coracana subsp. coracana]
MLTPRVLKLSLLRRLRAVDLPPQWRPRLLPARSYHARSYSSGGNSRPMRQFSEQNESNPRPLILHCSKEAGQGGVPKRCTTNRPAIGGPFKLYDTENNEVTESKLRGNWTLMYFGYTSCPDVGPRQVQKIADVVKVLESKYGIKIKPLFVTIDPQRDSSAQLKAYLSEFDPRIVGLTGPISAVRQIAQEYRVFFKKIEEVGQDYLVESSHNMYLLDPCLETVRCFGTEYEASDIAEAVTKEVQKASASSTN